MRDFLELTKPRITALVLVCTGVGYSFGLRAPLGAQSMV
jgi:heme O synthase-like polyprenyltransferase